MLRVVLDSNGVDPLVDLPGAFEALESAVTDGRLELLFTHVNIDELAATPDLERRSRLLLALVALGRLVPTGAFALGISRLNYGRLTGQEDGDVIEALRSGNIDHTRDALIAATARFEQCRLITNEKRLAAGSRERGIEVQTMFDLLAEHGFKPAAKVGIA